MRKGGGGEEAQWKGCLPCQLSAFVCRAARAPLNARIRFVLVELTKNVAALPCPGLPCPALRFRER